MTKQQRELQTTAPDLGELAESISGIAAKLADISSELDQLSDQLRPQRTGTASVRRPDPDREPEEQPPEAGATTQPPPAAGTTMGEPVDTSYTNPVQTPAASAAGALPSGTGSARSMSERVHVIAWVGSVIFLVGVLVLLLILNNR